MMKKWWWIFVIIVSGCSGPPSGESVRQNTEDSVVLDNVADQSPINSGEPKALPDIANAFHIDSLFNLKQFKEAHRGANSSPASRPKGQDSLLINFGYGHYHYFFFNRHQRGPVNLPGFEEFRVTTAVHAPIDGTEKFLTIEETMVGLNCKINDPLLQDLDLVGQTEAAVKNRLGDVLANTKYGLIFGDGQHIIAVSLQDEHVKSFRYRCFSVDVTQQLNNDAFLNYLFKLPKGP